MTDKPADPAIADFGKFITTLYQPDDLIEFRLFHHAEDLGAIQYFAKYSEVSSLFSKLELANQKDGREVYAGVNPRSRRGGTKKDVALSRCLFCDWDDVDASQFGALIAAAKLPTPTLGIFSGHGLHAYWLLKESITDLDHYEAILAKLITLAKSDEKPKDAPRVMRVPGLMNLGDPAKDETPVACEIIHDADVRYDYQDITGLVLKPIKPAPAAARVVEPDGLRASLSRRTKDYLATPSVNGSRNRDLFDAACDLYGNGLTEAQVVERLTPCGLRDGLGDGEIKTTIESACGKPRSPAKPIGSPPASKRAPWPVLADDAMYGLAGDIVRAIDPHTEADPVAVLIQTLVGFGSAAGRNPHCTADAARHGMNEFCVMVGKTSKGRKGTSWENSRLLLNGADPDWAENHIVSGLSSGEGLIWAVRDEVRNRVPVKSKGRHTGEYDDVVEHEGVNDKRLLVMEGELATPLKAIQREGNTLSPILRGAWDGVKLRSLTKNSPACATNAHISIIGHITQDELLRLLNATEAANGLGNRFLWVCVSRSKCLPDGGQIHGVDFSDISRRLSSALTNAKTADLITRDGEARELWHQVYPALSEGGHGLAGSLTSRAEAHVMRLSCIYALMDESRVVRLPHLKAALAIWNYCEASVFHLFGASMGDPIADELISLISFNSSGVTKTDIIHHFGKNVPSDRLDAALELLRTSSKARLVYQKTAGRPIQRWFAVTDTSNELNEVNELSPEPDDYEQQERAAVESEGM